MKTNHPYFDRLYALTQSLAHSQGFYSRLLATLDELPPDEIELIDEELKVNNIETDLDIILWLEQ